MIKTNSVVKYIISFCVIIFLLGMTFFNKIVLQYDNFGIFRTFIYMLNPPKIEPILKDKLIYNNNNIKSVIEFDTPYYGGHSISLDFNKKSEISYAKNFRINIDYNIQCESISKRKFVKNANYAAWGYTLAYFNISVDFDKNEKIKCDVDIRNIPVNFFNKYGPVFLLVKKISDA